MLICADARSLPLPDQYVQCVITSPPYWGLRDYKVDGQIGLEATPDLYVQRIVEVFREVRRVLRDDGAVWLVLGDCYGRGARVKSANDHKRDHHGVHYDLCDQEAYGHPVGSAPNKQLVGIPWRVAFALQADGWYLRSDVIWAKAHEFCSGGVDSTMPMGGKTADRPTPAHETVFLLTKSARYYYDEHAVAQQGVYAAGTRAAKGSGTREGNRRGGKQAQGGRLYSGFNERYFAPPGDGYAVYTGKRRLRDVWFISPQPCKEAHFATFPPKLVEPCLLAGSAHWQVDQERSVVLDPFCGSGTVGLVARQHGRYFIGCDLNMEYLALSRRRIG